MLRNPAGVWVTSNIFIFLRMNETGYAFMREGILFSLIGPAGSGKSTFAEKLVADSNGSIKLSVSVTTRPSRVTEKPDQSYYFVTRDEFNARIRRGDFFEWEEVHGNLYGTLKDTIDKTIRGEQDLMLDIDIKGALNIKKRLPRNAVNIFLVPPNEKILRERIAARGPCSPEEIKRRLETARIEYSILLGEINTGAVDYFIINDSKDDTFDRLCSIVRTERLRIGRINKEYIASICKITD